MNRILLNHSAAPSGQKTTVKSLKEVGNPFYLQSYIIPCTYLLAVSELWLSARWSLLPPSTRIESVLPASRDLAHAQSDNSFDYLQYRTMREQIINFQPNFPPCCHLCFTSTKLFRTQLLFLTNKNVFNFFYFCLLKEYLEKLCYDR